MSRLRWFLPARPTSRRVRAFASAFLLLGVVAGGLSQLRVETSLESFLPQQDQTLSAYRTFAQHFGGDPVVVLVESSQPKALFGATQMTSLLEAEGKLARLANVQTVYGPATLLNQIAGQTQNLLTELMGRRDAETAMAEVRERQAGGSKAAIAAAGQQAQSDFDARYGPLIVSALPMGLPTLRNPKFATTVVFDSSGYPRGQWRFLVPSQNAVAILIRPKASLNANQSSALVAAVDAAVGPLRSSATTVTVTGSPAVVAAISDEASKEAPLIGGAALVGVALCLFLGRLVVQRRRRFLPLAVTGAAMLLTLAIFGYLNQPVSLGVVAFASVLLGIGCYYPTYFALGARVRTVLVVAAATASSLATMALSPIPLVQQLGLALTTGVLCSAGLAFVARRLLVAGELAMTLSVRPNGRRAMAWILSGMVVLAAVGWAVLPTLSVDADVQHFAGGLPALNAAQHVADVLGSSGEVDLAYSAPNVTTPATLQWSSQVQTKLVTELGDKMRPAISLSELLSFLGTDPTQEQVAAGLRLLPTYLSNAVVTPDHAYSAASFGVSINDLAALKQTVASASTLIPPAPAGGKATFVGLPMVLVHAADLVSSDRWLVNLLGIGAAVAVLAIGLSRRSDAVRAGVAAGLATGLGFLALRVIGASLDPMTSSLGALTAAVACEFTVVYAEAVRTGSSHLRRAVRTVAAASIVGYGVLVGSNLVAVREFGALLAGAVCLAFVSSLVVVSATVRTSRPNAQENATTTHTDREVCHV